MHFTTSNIRFKLRGRYSREQDRVSLGRSEIEVVLAAEDPPAQLKIVSLKRAVTQDELDHSHWHLQPSTAQSEPGKKAYRLTFDGEKFTNSLIDGWAPTLYAQYQAIVFSGQLELTVTDGKKRATHLNMYLTYGPQ